MLSRLRKSFLSRPPIVSIILPIPGSGSLGPMRCDPSRLGIGYIRHPPLSSGQADDQSLGGGVQEEKPGEAPGTRDTPSLSKPVPPPESKTTADEKWDIFIFWSCYFQGCSGLVIREAVDNEFSNENTKGLVGAITEQAASLKTVLESVRAAVEAFKQKPQSPDKKIAFWTAYKSLADEFDKELQEKYGQDLDTAVLFAGLFSAVISAFIIQIQPELQPDPNALTQALLVAIVHKITSLPTALLPLVVSASPPKIVVIAQSLLYFSLFASLFAALLAVLGRQWLFHYNSVSGRGTIEERGLERQRKVDGMRQWRFDLVMQVPPLLLQVSLLLFATALSIYLRTIHHAIAAIVMTLTGLGTILYAAMIISAVVSPHSPFQTLLSFLFKTILDVLRKFPIPEFLRGFPEYWRGRLHSVIGSGQTLISQCWTVCMGVVTRMEPLLPVCRISQPRESLLRQPVPIFDDVDPPSEEASALLWAFETSTDPRLVESAAEMVPELRWPPHLDVRPALKRLDDTFKSCIDIWEVQDGMATRATACIRAFWFLDMVTEEDHRTPNLWTYQSTRVRNASGDLDSIQYWTRRPLDVSYPVAPITPWSLRFIAGQNLPEEMLQTTFLKHFSLNPSVSYHSTGSLFVEQEASGEFIVVFESLFRRLTDADPLNNIVANEMVIKAAQLADELSFNIGPCVARSDSLGSPTCEDCPA
ncbi:hypothetical protein B0H14DRAFT_3498359 [Mycena olivaceomarginata]|nr:hypothetical protein B0H14DRAFT_3498359 [Mycena olivaceomarginata]